MRHDVIHEPWHEKSVSLTFFAAHMAVEWPIVCRRFADCTHSVYCTCYARVSVMGIEKPQYTHDILMGEIGRERIELKQRIYQMASIAERNITPLTMCFSRRIKLHTLHFSSLLSELLSVSLIAGLVR